MFATVQAEDQMAMIRQRFGETENYKKLMKMFEPMTQSVRMIDPKALAAVKPSMRKAFLNKLVHKLMLNSKKRVAKHSKGDQILIKKVVREGEDDSEDGESEDSDDSDNIFNVCTLNLEGVLGGELSGIGETEAIVACIDDGDEDCFTTPFILLSLFLPPETLVQLAECGNGVEVLTEATENLFDECDTPELNCSFEDSSCTCAANPDFNFVECLNTIDMDTGIAFLGALIAAAEQCAPILGFPLRR